MSHWGTLLTPNSTQTQELVAVVVVVPRDCWLLLSLEAGLAEAEPRLNCLG